MLYPGQLIDNLTLVSLNCIEGFNINGSMLAMCLKAKWNPPFGTCISQNHFQEPLPAYSIDLEVNEAAAEGNFIAIDLRTRKATFNPNWKNPLKICSCGWCVQNATALIRALSCFNTVLVKDVTQVLLNIGADVNVNESYFGWTPLMLAAANGFTDVLEILIQNNAFLDATASDGSTAAIWAARYGKDQSILLLQHANFGIVTDQGDTVLTMAAKHGHANFIRTLSHLPVDIDVLFKDFQNCSAICWLIRSGDDIRIFKMLIERFNVDVNEQLDITLDDLPFASYMQLAAKFNRLEICNYLLAEGGNVNATNQKHSTSLIIAVSFGNIQLANLLIDNNADVTISDWRGYTALIFAASNGYNEIISNLVLHGANIDARTMENYTSLMFASSNSFGVDTVRILLELGANVSIRDNDGKTALAHAIARDHVEIAKVLLEYGSRVFLYTNSGISFFNLTQSTQMRRLLLTFELY